MSPLSNFYQGGYFIITHDQLINNLFENILKFKVLQISQKNGRYIIPDQGIIAIGYPQGSPRS
jgi:hypothetical protein